MWMIQKGPGAACSWPPAVHWNSKAEMPRRLPQSIRERESILPRWISRPMPNVIMTEPLGYLDFMKIVAQNSRMVLTDSGGVQEETTVLGVPCLTLRANTERPATVEEGTNVLVGPDPAKIGAAWKRVLSHPGNSGRIPELWDGNAAPRIIDTILRTRRKNDQSHD